MSFPKPKSKRSSRLAEPLRVTEGKIRCRLLFRKNVSHQPARHRGETQAQHRMTGRDTDIFESFDSSDVWQTVWRAPERMALPGFFCQP